MKHSVQTCIAICFVATAWATPEYQIRVNVPLPASYNAAARVTTFTSNGRIVTLTTGLNRHMYSDGVLTDLRTLFKTSGLSKVFTNDRAQYAQTEDTDAAQYTTGPNVPWQFLHTIGDYADSVYAKGMTENYVFGAQRRLGVSDFAEPLTYNTLTGQYQTIDMLPYGFNGGEIQDMNEQGDTLITASEFLFNQNFRFSDRAFIFRNGTMVHDLGHMVQDVSFLNSKGQVVGDVYNPNDVHYFKFWDGTTMHNISNLGLGDMFFPWGLSDDGTILVGSYSELHSSNSIYKDGQYYHFEDVCPGLPAGMKIYGAKMRPDGAIAGIGVLNSKSYLMRLDPVPEPASLLALAAGLCAILPRRRAR